MTLILDDLKKIWGEPTPNDVSELYQPLGQISIDSRSILRGNFFIPLKGKSFDGHEFLLEAFQCGAQATVIENNSKCAIPPGFLHWVVEDTLEAYQQLARLYRSTVNVPVVAVTGSTGKTTTREMIRSVLASIGSVKSSSENNNNDVGVPLTLMKGTRSDIAIVVEMAMRGFGEIERLSVCARPDIAVITNIGSAHIGLLGSRENIAQAKCEITSALNPKGSVVIPAGDELLDRALSAVWEGKVIRVALKDDEISYELSMSLSHENEVDLFARYDKRRNLLECDGYLFNLPLEGRHNARNFLIALAIAREFRVPWALLKNTQVSLPTGRSRRLIIGDMTIFDETYNASPDAVIAALDLLDMQPGRHFAVLGKMLELGSQSKKYHQIIARKVVRLSLDGLVVVATDMEADLFREVVEKSIARFAIVDDPIKAFDYLKDWLKSGDFLLLKGSRQIGLEKLLPKLKSFYD